MGERGMIWLVGAILFGLTSCSSDEVGSARQETGPSSPKDQPSQLVGPDGFAEAMREPGRLTINVHVPFEGSLPRTDVMIPYDEITSRVSELPAQRDASLAIYCKSGSMSAEAARDLSQLGYTDVVELKGGMDAWRRSGRPLVEKRPTG